MVSKLLRLLVSLSFGLSVIAATYYVDFDNGSDGDVGTSEAHAFKYSPSAPEATGNAASTALAPGDTVVFKPLVRYGGGVTNLYSGTAGNPVKYRGMGWTGMGTNRAIIDCMKRITTTWTNAPSSGDVRGNTNYLKLWYTTLPSDFGPMASLVQGTNLLFVAQYPNSTNVSAIQYDNFDLWRPVTNATSTNLSDSTLFTQSTADYWNDAWLGIHVQGNETALTPITNLNVALDRIEYKSTGNEPYPTPPQAAYSVLNHPILIDKEGEYATSPTDGKIYVWTYGEVDPNTVTWRYGALKQGFMSYGFHDVTVEGFQIEGPYGGYDDLGYTGVGIQINASSAPFRITVQSNYIRWARSIAKEGASTALFVGASTGTVSDNRMEQIFRSRGYLCSGTNLLLTRNTGNYIGRTALYFQGVRSGEISYNYLFDDNGAHGNAITTYGPGTSDIVVRGNQVLACGSPFTFEALTNLSVIDNIFNGMNRVSGRVQGFGTNCYGTILFNGNIVVGGTNDTQLLLEGAFSVGNVDARQDNNIINGGGITQGDGFGHTNRHNNIYISLADFQSGGHGWSLINGETVSTNVNAMFVDYANGDLRPKTGGLLIDTGFDDTALGFTTDILGVARGAIWEIGPYSDASAGSVVPPIVVSGQVRFSGAVNLLTR